MKPLSLLAAAVGLAALATAQETSRPFALRVGDPAPKLAVAKWVKGKPVKSFEKGHVYVIDFWATWCGPCRVAIPHLTETQKKVGDKVTIIGVAVLEEDPRKAEAFVKRMGEAMDYTIATDKLPSPKAESIEGAMNKTWIEASGAPGLPFAFIVDAKGKIAWMGHPLDLDEPLDKVIAGTWDAKAHLESKEKDAKGHKSPN